MPIYNSTAKKKYRFNSEPIESKAGKVRGLDLITTQQYSYKTLITASPVRTTKIDPPNDSFWDVKVKTFFLIFVVSKTF